MKKLNYIFCLLILTCFQYLHAEGSIVVKNAGMKQINGVYVQTGIYKDHPVYVKDECKIQYKGCRSKWVIYYKDKAFYKNIQDSDVCPLIDWQMTCLAKKDSLYVPLLQKN